MENLTTEERNELQGKLRAVRGELQEKHPTMDARKIDWMARRILC